MERKTKIGTQTVEYSLINLDSIDEVDRYPMKFQLAFELEFTGTVLENERLPDRLTETACDIMNLFSNQAEFEECKDTFNCKRPIVPKYTRKTDVKSSQSSPNLCPRSMQNVNLEEPRASSSANLHSNSRNSSSNSINSNKKDSPVNDLLNLNLNDPQPSPNNNNQPTAPQSNVPCDLLGSFNLQNIDLLNDLRSSGGDQSSPHVRSKNTSNIDLLNELFDSKQSSQQSNSNPDLLTNKPSARTQNGANEASNNLDPFEDLFANPTTNASSSTTNKPNGLRFPLLSTQPPLKPTQTKPTTSNANIPNKFTTSSNNSSAFKQSQSRPDYNRAYFNESASSNNGGPKLPEDAFGDLLSGFTKNSQSDWSSKNSGKSMAQLKREEMLREGSIDPLKIKVNEWKENKTRNIRALLGSLHTVVWPDCNWTAIGMHQLVNATDVKKMYYKACLAVHPDKLMGTEHEKLAKLIFVELNDAWSAFEKRPQI